MYIVPFFFSLKYPIECSLYNDIFYSKHTSCCTTCFGCDKSMIDVGFLDELSGNV